MSSCKKMDQLTILIPSCDKYGNLWYPFFTALFKHWPEAAQAKIHLLGNKYKYDDPRVTTIQFEDRGWSNNLIYYFENHCKTPYVFLMLEDYFLHTKVNNEMFLKYFEKIKDNTCDYIELKQDNYSFVGSSNMNTEPKLSLKSSNGAYRNSTQTSLWKTVVFYKLLKKDENAWQFELEGSGRSKDNKYCISDQSCEIFKYHNLVYKGNLSYEKEIRALIGSGWNYGLPATQSSIKTVLNTT
jgi:hypothetical protein